MPRTYVKKRGAPPYTLDDIKNAVQDVRDSKKTYRQASAFYNVPTTVIFNRIKGRMVDLEKMGAGQLKVIPPNEEEYLVDCLKARASSGYPCNKEEMKKLIGQYLTAKGIKSRFKNNIPGDDWYHDFMKRNPSLSLKKPELLQKARKDARKPYIVYDFYDMLKKVVEDNGIRDKPMYVFNTDESGFQNDPTRVRGIGEKGKALSRVSGGSGRDSTSVLGCVSADGTYLPPLIIFKGAAVQARWTSENCMPGTTYAATSNGWMEEPVFYNWFVTKFVPFVNKVRDERQEAEQKAILIFDGHKSHISFRIVEEALKANIILVKLPSHLTDRIQPLDVSVFGPVKCCWERRLVDYGIEKMGTGTGRLSKEKFGELLGEVLQKSLKRENIISGFESTGIFPVNSDRFPKKYFDAGELKVYLHLKQAMNYPRYDDSTPNEISHEQPSEQVNRMETSFSAPESTASIQDLCAMEITRTNTTGVQVIDTEPIPSTSVLGDAEDAITNGEQQKKSDGLESYTESSSPLLNKIFKLITMDKSTNVQVKSSILSALSKPLLNDEKSPHKCSPTKHSLRTIFKVVDNTPEKRKVVIPRLKQSNYGEILTTNEVMERLRAAQEEKEKKGLKIKIKKENKGKGRGIAKKTVAKSKLKKTRTTPDTDDTVPYVESDDSMYNVDDENQIDLLEPTQGKVKADDFILVVFRGGKRMTTNFKYVCHVDTVDNDDGEVNVTSLKCVDSSKILFSFNELDKSSVSWEDIIGILPEPSMVMKGERAYYKFEKPVDVFEKA